MRLITLTLLGALALPAGHLAGAQKPAGSEDPAPVPVEREPRHRPVFANDALRVIRLEMPLGDTSLYHTHSFDNLTIRIAGLTRTQTMGGDWGQAAPREPGSIGAAEYVGRTAPPHRVQSVGTVPFLQIVVENLRTGGWSTSPAVTAPELPVVQENRAFRAYKLTLDSHQSSTHQHAVPTVVVLVSGQVTAPDTPHPLLTTPGDWTLLPADARHTVTSSATSTTEIVEVEVR